MIENRSCEKNRFVKLTKVYRVFQGVPTAIWSFFSKNCPKIFFQEVFLCEKSIARIEKS
jgi:hypothetical protein